MATMTADKQKALQQGAARRRREDRRRSVARVTAFKKWLARGSRIADIPEIPSDTDYERWRERRGGRR